MTITVGVGGHVTNHRFFPEELTLRDVFKWNCSALIVDYVKYYTPSNVTRAVVQQGYGSPSANQICTKVMNNTRIDLIDTVPIKDPGSPEMGMSSSVLAIIISISSLALVFLLMPLITLFIIKRLRKETRVSAVYRTSQFYDDTDPNKLEEYDTFDSTCQMNYDVPYIASEEMPPPRYLQLK